MLKLEGFSKIFLYKGCIDMRKQINGLSAFVQRDLQLDPFENYLFVFCGKKKDSVKILYWRRTGFCLWQQKLEKDRFNWPKLRDESCIEMSAEKLEWLLDGYDVWRMKNHETLNYKYVS